MPLSQRSEGLQGYLRLRLSFRCASYRFFNSSNRLANASNSSTGPSSFVFGSEPSVGGISGSLGTLTSVSTFAFTLSKTSAFSFSPPFIDHVSAY